MRELWALVRILYPKIFSESETFTESWQYEGWSGVLQADKDRLGKARVLLEPIMLRRMKKNVEQNLPPKTEIMVRLQLSSAQKDAYKGVLSQDLDMASWLVGDKTVKNTSRFSRNLQALWQKLLFVCNHPYLLADAGIEAGEDTEDLILQSSKLHFLDQMLKKLRLEGRKVLIFSQYKLMLNILERFCAFRDYGYVRLDGDDTRVMRMLNIKRFNAPDSHFFIFLISTRAGGLGINLATADTVVHYDSDWNPQQDIQAQARAHRIGQKNPVTVYRLVTDGTVEERVIARAQRKLYLDAMVMGSASNAGAEEAPPDSTGKREGLKFGMHCLLKPDMDNAMDLDAMLDRAIVLHDSTKTDEEAQQEARRLQKVELSTATFDTSDALKELREFQGRDYHRKRKSSKIGGAPLNLPSKRRRVKRTYVDEDGYTLLKEDRDLNLADHAASSYGKKLACKSIYSGKRRGKEFLHEPWCWKCSSTDDVVPCSHCPKSYCPSCSESCDKRSGNFVVCDAHKCCVCKKTTSLTSFLFRCVGCPRSYCEDHIDMNTIIYIDLCPFFQYLNFHPSRNTCLVGCSVSCHKFYTNHYLNRPRPLRAPRDYASLDRALRFLLERPAGSSRLKLSDIEGVYVSISQIPDGCMLKRRLHDMLYGEAQTKSRDESMQNQSILRWTGFTAREGMSDTDTQSAIADFHYHLYNEFRAWRPESINVLASALDLSVITSEPKLITHGKRAGKYTKRMIRQHRLSDNLQGVSIALSRFFTRVHPDFLLVHKDWLVKSKPRL